MEIASEFVHNLFHIWMEMAPWLLLGLLGAGLIKAWLPADKLSNWLGRPGILSIIKAALLGTPLPLCSCSVIPAAIELRRGGASRGATVSFLVATPENGADSVAISYAILGPVMTVARLCSAVVSALITGFLAELASDGQVTTPEAAESGCCCCAVTSLPPVNSHPASSPGFLKKLVLGVRYAVIDLLRDIAGWTLVGILGAAVILTFVPPESMAQWGSGLWAMLAILAIGIPTYICATASTPIAAAMLAAGVSPGTVLVFLLAGPATNLGSVGIIQREIGGRATAAYLAGICVTSIVLGLTLDQICRWANLVVVPRLEGDVHLLPTWLAVAVAIILPLFLIVPRIYKLLSRFAKRTESDRITAVVDKETGDVR
ncbi:MAG: hypothetical protein CMJ81_11050 [Planctomycetaceae bacterium]|nr:hypothetical protein [Planctomycetaceae bacterium]